MLMLYHIDSVFLNGPLNQITIFSGRKQNCKFSENVDTKAIFSGIHSFNKTPSIQLLCLFIVN